MPASHAALPLFPLVSLSVFPSFPRLLSLSLSPFAKLPSLPALYYVLLKECASEGEQLQHQCWAGFKAVVVVRGVVVVMVVCIMHDLLHSN